MTAVLVHGVPERADVWDDLRSHLPGVEVVTPTLPGFGIPLPEGFEPTKERYLQWLVGELETLAEPVDLVGHDWGALLCTRLAFTRPDLIRTLATDAIALFDAAAGWHDLARVWQTPGAGEEFMANLEAMPGEQRVAFLAAAGMPESYARRAAGQADPVMNRAILSLYRSATDVHGDWGADLDRVPRPALVLVATEDPFSSRELTARVAERLGLSVARLEGLGHWWMIEDPATGAAALREHWAGAAPNA